MALSDRVVVMQRGRILQVDAPETVYRRPASREVAAFFGTPNFIEATVADCRPAGDGEWLVSIDGPTGRGDCRAGQSFSCGEAVSVVVRPEDVVLAGSGTVATNRQLAWQGRVVDGVFRGPRRSLTIETVGGEAGTLRFHVECSASRAASVGETVTLLVDADNAWALKP